MDPTLDEAEIKKLSEMLPSRQELESDAQAEARRAYLRELGEHLQRLGHEIASHLTRGMASIEVPEVWLGPIAQVLKHRELAYLLTAPPKGTNMATVVVRWFVDHTLTPPVPEAVPRKCDKHSQCRHMLHHRGSCGT